MADTPTTGDLFKAKAILEADVVAAVDAFMAHPTTKAFLFGDGYRIDLAEAVQSAAEVWLLPLSGTDLVRRIVE